MDDATTFRPQGAGVTMLNSASLNAINNAKFSQRFVKPLYDSYCFANLPQTIEFLLTGKRQSGVYEWNYYEPLVDQVITPLLFSYAGDKERDTLKRSAIPSTSFYPQQTFYRKLQSQGVRSYIFQSHIYTPSTYSDIVYRGAT